MTLIWLVDSYGFSYDYDIDGQLQSQTLCYTRRRSWGLDLSGSLQGAGGVGGLVMTEHFDAQGNVTANYYPAYDGNGNIAALVDNGANVVATWSYDAYGNVLATTGNPSLEDYGFSTKPYDELTGLYYYGYRYYDLQTGRWPSRDPIEEDGGINLYNMIGNEPVGRWDELGRQSTGYVPDIPSDRKDWPTYEGEEVDKIPGDLQDEKNITGECRCTQPYPRSNVMRPNRLDGTKPLPRLPWYADGKKCKEGRTVTLKYKGRCVHKPVKPQGSNNGVSAKECSSAECKKQRCSAYVTWTCSNGAWGPKNSFVYSKCKKAENDNKE